jgi:hypothetical protein
MLLKPYPLSKPARQAHTVCLQQSCTQTLCKKVDAERNMHVAPEE